MYNFSSQCHGHCCVVLLSSQPIFYRCFLHDLRGACYYLFLQSLTWKIRPILGKFQVAPSSRFVHSRYSAHQVHQSWPLLLFEECFMNGTRFNLTKHPYKVLKPSVLEAQKVSGKCPFLTHPQRLTTFLRLLF